MSVKTGVGNAEGGAKESRALQKGSPISFSKASFPAVPITNLRGRKNKKGRKDKREGMEGDKIKAFQPGGRRNVYFFFLNTSNFSNQLKIIKCIKKAGMQFSRAQLLNNSSSAAPISLINPEV